MSERPRLTAQVDCDDDAVLPEGAIFTVTIQFRMECAATRSQIEEWVKGELMCSGGIALDNPCLRNGPDAIGEPQLTDTRRRFFEKLVSTKERDGVTYSRFSRWTEPDGRRDSGG